MRDTERDGARRHAGTRSARLVRWLKHAFAVEAEGPAEPTLEQQAVVERVCAEIVRRRLAAPALVFLESVRPMNYLASQSLHFFHPILAVVADARSSEQFACFLAQRGSIDYLCQRIETLEQQGPATTQNDPNNDEAHDTESQPD